MLGALRGESLAPASVLKKRRGETIGLCSVMFKRAMPRMEKIVGLLRLLAPLAGRELALMYQQRQSQSSRRNRNITTLDTMMSHAPVGIGKVDLGGKILWANPAIEKMPGYSQEELQQLTVAEINHPDDWQTSIALYDALKRGERPAFTQEKRYLHRDGTVLGTGDGDPDPQRADAPRLSHGGAGETSIPSGARRSSALSHRVW